MLFRRLLVDMLGPDNLGDEGRRAIGLALEEARQRRERRLLAGRETRDEDGAPGDRHGWP